MVENIDVSGQDDSKGEANENRMMTLGFCK
jgi:hypothetical protein